MPFNPNHLKVTNHFRERLFERFGVKISFAQEHAMLVQMRDNLSAEPPVLDEDRAYFDVKIEGVAFMAIINTQTNLVMTAVPDNRMGRQRFVKKVRPLLHPEDYPKKDADWRERRNEALQTYLRKSGQRR